MGADSEVFSIVSSPAVLGGLATKSIQKIKGKGAHGVDFFTAYGHKLLVVPSYYGCGQKPQAGPRESWKCRSTAVLEWRDALGSFVEIATLGTHGPAQTDHYTDRDGRTFLVVGENFANEITIFRIEERSNGIADSVLAFNKAHTLPVAGAGSMAVFLGPSDGPVATARGEVYIAATSYHDPRTGWQTKTPVYKLAPGSDEKEQHFQEVQTLDSRGPHDAVCIRPASPHAKHHTYIEIGGLRMRNVDSPFSRCCSGGLDYAWPALLVPLRRSWPRLSAW